MTGGDHVGCPWNYFTVETLLANRVAKDCCDRAGNYHVNLWLYQHSVG